MKVTQKQILELNYNDIKVLNIEIHDKKTHVEYYKTTDKLDSVYYIVGLNGLGWYDNAFEAVAKGKENIHYKKFKFAYEAAEYLNSLIKSF